MSGKSTKNMHLEHLEDDIINLGYKGAQQSIAFVEALLQLFSGESKKQVNITVKWDGAPAVVAGKDPETGFFFVATKHGAFSKTPKLGESTPPFGVTVLIAKFPIWTTATFDTPAGPVAPVAPAEPVAPAAPVAPVAPDGPVAPAGPVAP